MTEQSTNAAESPKKEEFVLTAEIMAYENGRHDKIIAAGVLLFAFFLGSYRETYPDVPLRLATGQHIAEKGIPKHDPFTFGAPADKVWVNPSWLFDLAAFRIHDTAGETALGIVKALCGALAMLPLLFLRYRGPTLWWSAVCTFLAATACAPRFFLGPEILTLGLLSLLLLCWHASGAYGLKWPMYATVPIMLLWANLDSSWFVGAGVLVLLGLGEVVQAMLPRSLAFGDRPPAASRGVLALALGIVGAALSAATPYGAATTTFPFDWTFRVLPQAAYAERDFFGWNGILQAMSERETETRFYARLLDGKLNWAETALVALAVGGVASFFLNYGRFNVGRFLLAIAGVALPTLATRYAAPAAILLTVALCLNAQEAFLDAFGSQVRIDRGWVLYSQVGRMLTIVSLFVALLVAPTGRVVPSNLGLFGFGLASKTFPDAESCKALAKMDLKGRAFIPSAIRLPAQLAWETPDYKYMIDSRWQLFADKPTGGGDSLLEEYTRVQQTLLIDDVPDDKIWKPFFAKHQITHLVFDPYRGVNRNALRVLLPDVATLMLKDRISVVGWTKPGGSHPDVARFAALKLKPNKTVFDPPPAKKDEPPVGMADIPSDSRSVTPPTVIDWLWRNRYSTPQGVTSGQLYPQAIMQLEIPGSLYLSIKDLRKAIAEQPDNPVARSSLAATYNMLYSLEAGVADAGLDREFQTAQKRLRAAQKLAEAKKNAQDGNKKPAPKKEEDDGPVPHPLLRPYDSKTFLPLRHFQMMVGYREALRAFTPEGLSRLLPAEEPPIPILDLAAMGERCRNNGYLDQSLEVFKLAVKRTRDVEFRDRLNQEIANLEKNVETKVAVVDQEIATQQKRIAEKSPEYASSTLLLTRLQLCRANGLLLRAIKEYEEAPPTDPEVEYAKPLMAEIYLEMGFAEKCRDTLAAMPRQLIQRPGDFEYMSAQVQLAGGQYDEARKQFEAAVAIVRRARIERSLGTVENLVSGKPLLDVNMQQGNYMGPLFDRRDLIADLRREAQFSFELGLLLLEMGKPKEAVASFAAALEASPRFPYWRPIVDYYCALIPNAKMPANPDPYMPDDELLQRFERRTPAATPNEPKKDGANASAPAGKTPDKK